MTLQTNRNTRLWFQTLRVEKRTFFFSYSEGNSFRTSLGFEVRVFTCQGTSYPRTRSSPVTPLEGKGGVHRHQSRRTTRDVGP